MARRAAKQGAAVVDTSYDARSAVFHTPESHTRDKQPRHAQQSAKGHVQQPSCPAVKQVCKTLALAKKETEHYTYGCLVFGGKPVCNLSWHGRQYTRVSSLRACCCLCRVAVCSWSSCLVPSISFCPVRCRMLAMEGRQLLQTEVGESGVEAVPSLEPVSPGT